MTDQPDMCKVVLHVVSKDGSLDIETPWATKVGEDLYRIENSPFYAYSLSSLDIVYAPYSEEEERPTFERVVKKSGHRTVRTIFDPPIAEGNISMEKLQGLVNLGCSYEGAIPSYISVDIPPEIDFGTVRKYLIDEDINFEHADPTYEELFPEEDDVT